MNEEWFEPDIYCHFLADLTYQVYLLRCSLPFTGQKPKATKKDFLELFRRPKKVEPRLKLVEKPLKRTPSGKLIDPEWQKKIDAREAQLRAMLQMGPKDGEPEPEPETESDDSENKTMRRKQPRKRKA